MKDSLERIERKIDRVETLLNGNGEPERGLIVQFHRVKQGQEALIKIVWLFAAVFTSAITALFLKLLSIAPALK